MFQMKKNHQKQKIKVLREQNHPKKLEEEMKKVLKDSLEKIKLLGITRKTLIIIKI